MRTQGKRKSSSNKIPSRNDKRGSYGKEKSNSPIAKEEYNDPSWYTASGQLAKDVASLSFNNALGAPSVISASNTGTVTLNNLELRAPGIMGIYTAPSFGVSTGGHSALNLAAKNFYSWIRHANSGHSNYDSPDLMLYLGAMDSLYAIVAYFMRAYGVARVYSQVNRYIGDGLLKAMGLVPDDVRTNLAQLRGYINMLITKLSAFATPDTMSMFKRHFWMFSGVYKDESVSKSQMYMYVPAVLWTYNETNGAGFLEATPWVSAFASSGLQTVTSNPVSLNTLYLKANAMLSKIVNSEDINIMSGDILKAYPNATWKLSLIPEDYAVVPVYSEEVLDQIHNTTFTGNVPCSTIDLTAVPTCSLQRLNVFQDASIGDGALLFMPQFINAWHLDYDKVLDMHYESPTPEEVLVATRNMISGHSSITTASANNAIITDVDTCGSDICMWCELVVTSNTGSGWAVIPAYRASNSNSTDFSVTAWLSQFNKYPWFYRIGNALGASAIGIVGELDNYTVISKDDMSRMHDTSLLSLLGVPFLGTAAK